MKRAVLRILACIVLLLAAPTVLGIFGFCIPSQYEETFLGELKYKYDALEKTEGKRIVIIGGSGVAFGQRSDLMEQELPGYRVVNFGMYASLGSSVMLDLALPLLREGDIVIFSPEQSSQTLSMYFNPESMWQAVDGRFDLLTKLSGDNLGAMLGHFGYFAARKFNFYTQGNTPNPTGVYSKSAFNRYGDIDYADRGQNVMSGGFDPNLPLRFESSIISEDFIAYLNAYTQDCKERGIRFYYRFCPMNDLAMTQQEQTRFDDYCAYLAGRLECDVLGDPHNSLMEAGWFYDTNFHLNSAGAIVNTYHLVEDIKKILSDRTPVNISLPEMPPMGSAQIVDGDNSDAQYFRYEERNGEIYLVGLTDVGKNRQSLTIPVQYEGLPVTGFAADVFAGNTVIREITVQSSITRIENGSFAGCTALERLILTGKVPEKCSVGTQLLEGTDCTIYVPRESISAYMTNYFWSVHAARIQPSAKPSPDTPERPTDPVESETGIRYHANGGYRKNGQGDTIVFPMDSVHLRANTAQGSRYFARDGYVLLGWNTEPDGSGTQVGLGSRIEKQEDLNLYAQWAKESEATDFAWKIQQNEVHIVDYLGSSRHCVVPEMINGMKVTRICADAFRDARIDTLVLPPSIFAVERQAFAGSSVGEIYLYDTLYNIYDESFAGCDRLTTLHINAATSPVYSGSYYDAFADKYDWLLSIQHEKKIVLFSGSSARYGYDSARLRQAFPEYQVANMGVYAFTNALPQYELIRQLMQPGDILLSGPEFDTVATQFCVNNSLDTHFWAMMESNYDAVARLDMGQYSGVFDSLRAYLNVRTSMGGGDYSISPKDFDDDGNRYDYPTYNQYGDFVLIRPNSPRDELLKWGLADYTVNAFPMETVQSLNRVYERFLADGITVYFTYTPRNIRAITPESTVSARRELHGHLVNTLCVPVISDIEESLFSGIYFYLIDSHLSTEGVQIRTERIIADLRRQMEKE